MAIGNVFETAAFLPAPPDALGVFVHSSSRVIRVVIIVPPLFEERKACHPALVDTARALASQGAAVLRFDWRGSGDSSSEPDSFSLPDWLADLHTAAEALRRKHPLAPQIWLGVRTGALLALHQAALSDAASRPAALLLWDPVSGPDFMRQLLQRRMVNEMMAYGQARQSRNRVVECLNHDETVDFDGFAVTGRMYRDLQELQPRAWPGPALLVTTGPDTRTADTCQGLAPAATRLALRLPPYWNTVGRVDTRALTEASTAWVAANLPEAPCGSAAPRRDSANLPPDLPPAMPDGTERMVAFSGAQGVARGVLHLPSAHAGRGRILFLHGWSGDRTGPHRMFVQAARLLAAQGYTCLRFDYTGRGDSGGAIATATIATMTADARAALAWLRAEAPAGGPITLLAICSGCKVAIQTATAEPDAAQLVLWSAESMGSLRHAATGLRKRMASLRTYARKLLRPETWGKLLRGEVRGGMVGKALVQAEARSAEEARQEDRALRSFQQFRGAILFVFGGSDPDAPGSSQAYARFCRQHGISFADHTVPHAGHSYYGSEWAHEVLQVTEDWLKSRRTPPAHPEAP